MCAFLCWLTGRRKDQVRKKKKKGKMEKIKKQEKNSKQ